MTSSTYSASSGASLGGSASETGGFLQRYETICKSHHLSPLRDIKLHLTKGVLNFVADKIKLDDWSPLLKAIRYDRSLHFIGVRSRYCGSSGVQVLEDINTEKKAREMTRGSVLFTKYLIGNLVESLAECVSRSKALTCLQLQYIPLYYDAAVTLSEALMNPNHLQILCLSDCNLGDSGCEELCRALKSSPSLVTLDLTNCQLTESGVEHLANLIKAQEVSRYNECWKHSLRYRSVTQEIIPGLRRVTVNHNPDVGDNGLSFIVEALYDDYWIKAVDMQNCGLTDWGCALVLKLVDLNKELVVFDVRKNAIENVASLVDIVRKLDANSSEADKDSYLWLEDNHPPTRSSGSYSTTTLHGTTRTRSRYVNSSIRMKAASYTEGRNPVDKTLRVSRSTGGIDRPIKLLDTRKSISTPALAVNITRSLAPNASSPNMKVKNPKLTIRRNRLTLNDFCPPIITPDSRVLRRSGRASQSKNCHLPISRQSSTESKREIDDEKPKETTTALVRPSTATKRLIATKAERNGFLARSSLRTANGVSVKAQTKSNRQSHLQRPIKLPMKNNSEMIITRTETDTTEFKKSNSSLHFSHEYRKQMTRQIEIKETLSLNTISDNNKKIKELFRKYIQIGDNCQTRDDYPVAVSQQEFIAKKNHPREKLKHSTSESDNSTSSLSDIYPLDIDYEGSEERKKNNVLPGVYDFYVKGSLSPYETELYRQYSNNKM